MLYRINKIAQMEDDFDVQIREYFFKYNKQFDIADSEYSSSIADDHMFGSETDTTNSYLADLSRSTSTDSSQFTGHFRKLSSNSSSSLFDTFQSNKAIFGGSYLNVTNKSYEEDGNQNNCSLISSSSCNRLDHPKPATFKRFELERINEVATSFSSPQNVTLEKSKHSLILMPQEKKKEFSRLSLKIVENENHEVEETRKMIDLLLKQKKVLSPQEAEERLNAVKSEHEASELLLCSSNISINNNNSDSGLGSNDFRNSSLNQNLRDASNSNSNRLVSTVIQNRRALPHVPLYLDIIDQRNREFSNLLNEVWKRKSKDANLLQDEPTM